MKMKQKSEPLKSLKRELVKALWNPTWEPEELLNICERLDTASKCAKSLSRHRTYRNLQQTHTFMIFKNKGSQPTKIESLSSPMKWNFKTVNFDIQPTNPQADIQATGRCECWITDVNLMKHQINDTEFPSDDHKLSEVYTATVACI